MINPDLETKLRGTYVIGKTGTGKSSLLARQIATDIDVRGYGVLVLDPHGSLVDSVIDQLGLSKSRVHVIELADVEYPFGLNIYQCADPLDPLVVARTVSPVMQLFERLWGPESSVMSWGPRMAQFLRNCALLLVENPGYTMAEIPLILTDTGVLRQLLRKVTNPSVRVFWESFLELKPRREQLDRVDSTFNKVDDFVSSPLVRNIIGQSQSTIDIEQLMAESGVLMVKLDPQLSDLTSVVGALLISRVLSAALLRPANAPPFMLYADEYQRFATPDFGTLLSEARKYNVGTVVAHQFRRQLDERNKGATLQAGSVYVFEVTPEDGQELAGLFDATPSPSEVNRMERRKVAASRPLESILRHGYSNSGIAKLVRAWFEPAQRGIDGTGVQRFEFDRDYFHIRQYEGLLASEWPDRGGYIASASATLEGLDILEAVLYRVMRGDLEAHSVEVFEEYLRSVPWLMPFIGFANNYRVVRTETRTRREVFEHVAVERVEHTPRFLKEVESEWRKSYEGILSRASFEDIWTDWGSSIEVERALELATLYPLDEFSLVTAEEYHSRAKWETFHLRSFYQTMVLIGIALAESPVSTETGQYDVVARDARPYADVTHEIANELSTQGRFHLWSRIGDRQVSWRLEAPQAFVADSDAAVSIRQRSRAKYCRPRADVEGEIKKRQWRLITNTEQPPPPRSTSVR